MTETEKRIIELLKDGYSLKKICEKLQKNYKEIRQKKKELIEEGFLTEEDIRKGKEDKKRRELQANPKVQTILKNKRKGLSDVAISKMGVIDMNQSQVSSYVRDCVKLGLITSKEIEKAKEEKEKKDKDNNPNRKRVLEGLRLGELDTEIAKYTTVGYQQVKNIRLSLIEEGFITQEEIDSARQKAEISKKQQKQEENKANEVIDKEQVLAYLILGYDTYTIRMKMKIADIKEYRKVVQKLKQEKRITEQEIKEYRERKEKADKERVLEGLKEGMSQREIAESIDASLERTQTYIKKIKQEQGISDEDILRWKDEQKTSLKKRKEVVLEGLREGLSRTEIIQKYPEQELESTDVKYCRNMLIKEGVITQEEIVKYRKLRQQEKNQNKTELTDSEKLIQKYLKKGYEAKEIADLTERSVSGIFGIISRIKKKGKITDEEIKQARMQRKEQEQEDRIKQQQREKLQKFNRLKREIDSEVRLGKKVSAEKEGKIREYIDLCHEIYKKEKITNMELSFLKQAMNKIPINEEDIIKFAKRCVNIEEYKEALIMVRKREQLTIKKGSKVEKQTLINLENSLVKACKVQKAIQLMRKGNSYTDVISSETGLSKDEVDILKIKLSTKPFKLFSVSGRERILEELLKHKDSCMLQKKLGISDFEMRDIEEQFEYRKIKKKKKEVDSETQVKQDSEIRIAVLCTKLGRKPETIARILKLEDEVIEEYLKQALEYKLIKTNELQGINPLEYQVPKFEQLEL